MRILKIVGLSSAALIALCTLVLLVWYQIDGVALASARQYLQGDGYRAEQQDDGDWLFTPDAPNGAGLAIMHGALIEPLSYARTGAFFAQRGYRVWIPRGRMRLSAISADRFAAELDAMPEEHWLLLGHSMGGLTAFEVKQRARARILGIAVWAGSMPGDFSTETLPVLYLWGDHDAMIPPERLARTKKALPSQTLYETVQGGNHRGFAMYSHQFFDGEASIPLEAQIARAQDLTLPFFERLRTPR